jgi:FkbM family methyltransferase
MKKAKCFRCACDTHCGNACANCENCDHCDCSNCLQKDNVYPTGKDFWVAYNGQHTQPTFVKDAGDGQSELRREAYSHIKSWRGCIDAGANVGMWTRNLMKDFEIVHCFEPNPIFVECWKKNIPHDQNAILHEFGLGDVESTATFHEPLHQMLDRTPGSIHIKTLDSFELTNIDFIKIDVDGYEDLLMKGAVETVANNSPVINIEMKRAKRPHVVRVAEDILKKLGYKIKKRTRSDEVWLKSL